MQCTVQQNHQRRYWESIWTEAIVYDGVVVKVVYNGLLKPYFSWSSTISLNVQVILTSNFLTLLCHASRLLTFLSTLPPQSERLKVKG